MFNFDTTREYKISEDRGNSELGMSLNFTKLKTTQDMEEAKAYSPLDHYSQMHIILDHRGYNDIGKIAVGGSGIVVSASKGGHKFALKSTTIFPYYSNIQTPWEVLNEEAKNLEFLHNKKVPNLVDFYGFDSAFFDGFYGGFLQLELCGGSAFDGSVYSAPKLVGHTLKAAETLAHMHEHGLVHGDIKPNNILTNFSGKVRLVDLATAREPLKEYIVSPCSPGFLAPELFSTTVRTKSGDVFSLAATLYEATSGKNIRGGKNYGQVFNQFVNPLSPRIMGAKISKKLDNAIMSGLESNYRPNLNEFTELLLKTPEAKDYCSEK